MATESGGESGEDPVAVTGRAPRQVPGTGPGRRRRGLRGLRVDESVTPVKAVRADRLQTRWGLQSSWTWGFLIASPKGLQVFWGMRTAPVRLEWLLFGA